MAWCRYILLALMLQYSLALCPMNASSSGDQLTCSCDGGFTEAANGSCGQCLAGTYSEITPSRQYRFTVLRNNAITGPPGIGEIRFFNTTMSTRVPIPIAFMSNVGGANQASLKYLNDGKTDLTNFNQHWYDDNYRNNISYTSTIMFHFDTPVSITSYEWFTTEFTTRYPVSWRFEKFHTQSGQWIELHYIERWTGTFSNYLMIGPFIFPCMACPLHSSSPTASAVAESCSCKAGYAGESSKSCVACAADSFSASSGMQDCSACPSNAVTRKNTVANTACLCSPGYTGIGICTPCTAGSYKNSTGGEICSMCEPGKFNSNVAQQSSISCLKCGRGKYSAQVAAASPDMCLSCAPGTWHRKVGVVHPDECKTCLCKK